MICLAVLQGGARGLRHGGWGDRHPVGGAHRAREGTGLLRPHGRALPKHVTVHWCTGAYRVSNGTLTRERTDRGLVQGQGGGCGECVWVHWYTMSKHSD